MIPARGARALCLTGVPPDPEAMTRALAALPAGRAIGELRADLLRPSALAAGGWRGLPASGTAPWVFTWRSPAEGGGGGERPAGLLDAALASGYAWVDVEAGRFIAGDGEAMRVPPERRWVSRHASVERGGGDLRRLWDGVTAVPGALHKLVIAADRFAANDAVLDLIRERAAADATAFSIFASGATGHASRILAGLLGNAVTFAVFPGAEGTAEGQPDAPRLVEEYRWFDQPADPPLFGVLGFPARGSRSPAMHNAAFRAGGIPGLYLPLPSEDPDAVLAWLRSGRLRGLSVTAPYKGWAAERAAVIEDSARDLGAVNTLFVREGRLTGANTDRLAARELLAEAGVGGGARVAVIGAGGGAAAILAALRDLGAAGVLYARRPEAAVALAGRLDGAVAGRPETLDPAGFAAVVNTTPLGHGGPLPPALAGRVWGRATLLELVYASGPSALARLARAAEAPVVDGLTFLARQGRHQFRIWTGRDLPAARFLEGARRA